MICRFCGEDKPLIKAHIIPRGFHKLVSPGNAYADFIVETPTKNIKLEYLQNGPYDQGILCADCDNNVFKEWETYGYEFFLKEHNWKKYSPIGDIWGINVCIVDDYDYKNLKLFILLVLWRMSITSHPSYNNVNLGPYEKKIHEMLLSNNPGNLEDIPIVLGKIKLNSGEPDPSLRHAMIGPFRFPKWHGFKNGYMFSMAGYQITIKVNGTSLKPRERLMCLSPIPPTEMIEFPYKDSGFEMIVNELGRLKGNIKNKRFDRKRY